MRSIAAVVVALAVVAGVVGAARLDPSVSTRAEPSLAECLREFEEQMSPEQTWVPPSSVPSERFAAGSRAILLLSCDDDPARVGSGAWRW